MSNVHAKHDGSLGHQTLMFSSHSAWNSTPDFIVQSLHVNPQTSESTIKPHITSRHRNSIRVQAWQSQALHATKKPEPRILSSNLSHNALMKAHARAPVYANNSHINCLSQITISQRLMTTGHMAGPDIHLRKTVEVSRKPLSGVTRAKATSGILYITVHSISDTQRLVRPLPFTVCIRRSVDKQQRGLQPQPTPVDKHVWASCRPVPVKGLQWEQWPEMLYRHNNICSGFRDIGL